MEWRKSWNKVEHGEVEWQEVTYRGLAQPIKIPVAWVLKQPSEWVSACKSKQISAEFEKLAQATKYFEPNFFGVLVTHLKRVSTLAESEFSVLAALVNKLEEGCLEGAPLRYLSGYGNDTKFVEKNRHLLQLLLDVRFEGRVSEVGIEAFLDAKHADQHWILFSDLGNQILPFSKVRVTSADLDFDKVPCQKILVVENESCLQSIPQIDNCVAVLGCGQDLSWLQHKSLGDKKIGYWGDLDSWGFQMLAKARNYRHQVESILMDLTTAKQNHSLAVEEPTNATVGDCLTRDEQQALEFLEQQPLGRIEQEFLAADIVQEALLNWAKQTRSLTGDKKELPLKEPLISAQ